jgi:hypothetical protein
VAVEHIELLVEEPSIEAALRLLLPKIIGSLSFAIYPSQCKNELIARLPHRLRGYAAWIPDTWRIVVIVDRDDDDCQELKVHLEMIAADAGLMTRSKAGSLPYIIVNRLVIEELEAWYFGDWEAVRASFPRVPATITSRAKYRVPDAVKGGTWEAFEQVLQSAGYFKIGLAKIEAAKAIAANMIPERNSSRSFQVLRQVLAEMAVI